MKPRERVITAMRRGEPDRVPKYADFSPGIYESFLNHVGYAVPEGELEEAKGRPMVVFQDNQEIPDPADYFNYDVRLVEFGETDKEYGFLKYFDPKQLPAGRWRISEWGIAFIKGSEHHFEDMLHPMTGFASVEEIDDYPWPDITAQYRRDIARERIKQVQAMGLAAVGFPPMKGGTIFETAWGLRGYEALMLDMMINKELATCLLDKITGFSISNACFLAECGADIIETGDDFGMQDRMMISPTMWREWFKPRYAELITSVKDINPDALIFYHSDGMIKSIIPELIEIGVDILNPVQPECMDPRKLKQEYGDRLAFWGTIGTQSTMPFGTPAEVKAVVKERIHTVGKDGGFLIAPTHKLEPDVPWENVLAFFEAVDEYGAYE